jgi:hypothetical protein
MPRLAGIFVMVAIAVGPAPARPAAAAPPVVTVSYPGSPRGMPKLDDLAAFRAMGFAAVTWTGGRSGAAALRKLAAAVDLQVVDRADATIKAAGAATTIGATAWRAVARGARVLQIDPGQAYGTGFTDARGDLQPWVRPAAALANQIAANPGLIETLRGGPSVEIVPPAPVGLEVKLLDGGRAWVLVATSTAKAGLHAVAKLPADVPYALWVSLIDGSMLSMLRQASGPRWTLTIAPGEAKVYVIDKKTGQPVN